MVRTLQFIFEILLKELRFNSSIFNFKSVKNC